MPAPGRAADRAHQQLRLWRARSGTGRAAACGGRPGIAGHGLAAHRIHCKRPTGSPAIRCHSSAPRRAACRAQTGVGLSGQPPCASSALCKQRRLQRMQGRPVRQPPQAWGGGGELCIMHAADWRSMQIQPWPRTAQATAPHRATPGAGLRPPHTPLGEGICVCTQHNRPDKQAPLCTRSLTSARRLRRSGLPVPRQRVHQAQLRAPRRHLRASAPRRSPPRADLRHQGQPQAPPGPPGTMPDPAGRRAQSARARQDLAPGQTERSAQQLRSQKRATPCARPVRGCRQLQGRVHACTATRSAARPAASVRSSAASPTTSVASASEVPARRGAASRSCAGAHPCA